MRFILIRVLRIYLLLCLTLYLTQNFLIYPRYITGAALSRIEAEARATELGLFPYLDAQGQLLGYVSQNFTQSAKGTFIAFHGNGSWGADRGSFVNALQQRGFRVLLYEYPGYGGRAGSPSERTIVPDAEKTLQQVSRQFPDQPLFLIAESVGTGVAGALLQRNVAPIHGVILINAFDSLTNVAWSHYPFIPVPWLITDSYDNFHNFEAFSGPVVVAQSGLDEVVPMRLKQRFYDHLHEPKKLILFPQSHHNDWPDDAEAAWWNKAVDFVDPPKL